jgi:hypothetical protein
MVIIYRIYLLHSNRGKHFDGRNIKPIEMTKVIFVTTQTFIFTFFEQNSFEQNVLMIASLTASALSSFLAPWSRFYEPVSAKING